MELGLNHTTVTTGFEVSVVNPEEGYSETIYIYSKFLDSNAIKELLND